MKKYAFLAVSSILLVSAGLWAGQFARDAWPAPSDGAGPDDTAAEYALTAAGNEPGRGTILFEYYWGTDGTISSLESLPTFPNYPDDREWRASLEGPTDWRDHYGICVRGYLYPPGTGNYTFWIASDDQSQLWLSKDESPGQAVQIASMLVWTPARDFDNTGGGFGGPQQRSSPIPLTAGKRYYIEVLQAEGIGGDNLAVAWQGPGIRSRTIIAGQYLSPLLGQEDVIDSNLIGWWKLQEGSGDTVNDSSGHDKHGTICNSGGGLGPNGAVWVSDPERGTVLSFDGDDLLGAYVDAGTIPAMDLADDFTWAFWAKQDVGQSTAVPGGGNDVMLGNRFGGTETPVQFIKFTPGRFEYYNDDPSYTMVIDYVDLPGGQWVHHAAVKKGTTLTYYRDGVQAGTSTLTKTMDENPFFLGGDAGGERWRGWLSDVRIYDRGLSAVEIRALIHAVRGEYFTNMTLSGSPALTRLDSQIYFNWAGDVFPGTGDQCSVRWTGEVEPAFTEPYTFYVNTDDGARLWLNGNPIIDAWWDQAPTEYASQPIPLVAGQRYSIRLEYYENTGTATCELRWSSPSTPKQVIPSARLHPPEPGTSTDGPSITLDPTEGPEGTNVTIAGSGFAANTVGDVTFAGASKSVTTSPTGTFSTTMTVPSVWEGDYPVQADIPSGGATEASATFTITTSGTAGTLTMDPGIGHVNDTISIAGSGFSPGTAGRVFFDTDRDNTYDSGEPVQSLTTLPTGAFSTTLTVPTVAPGDYPVLADFPIGGSVEGTATFSVVGIPIGMGPYLTVVPFSGSSGAHVMILGGRFAARASGRVFFDSNGNGRYDSGEPVNEVTSLGGSIAASLTVPSVPIGAYSIRADCPTGGSVEASSSFTVTVPAPTLTLDRTSGGYYNTNHALMITGSGFTPNATGDIWFDTNGDGLHEDSEPWVLPTASSTGELPGPYGLYIPNVPGGIYTIWADIPRGGSVETSASYTVIPSINVGPTISIVGSEQSVAVGGFAANTAGRVFWDRDNDNAYDVGEPVQSPTTRDDGSVRTSLIVPNVAPGDYQIVGEFPIGGPVVSAPVTVFAATKPLTVTPTSGTWGTDFRAYVLLPVGSEYVVFFDIDRDNTRDEGEPSGGGTISSGGVRVSTLRVPGVQAGSYSVLLQSPFGGPIVDSATFAVVAATSMSMTVTPTTGSTGTVIDCRVVGVPANTSYRLFFDRDGDNTWDPGEPNESGTTGNTGGCYVKLVAPAVQMGDYPIRFDCPIGGPIEASATFTLIPAPANPVVTINPTSGPVGTHIYIRGDGFGVRVQYMVFFDRDGDGAWDEPYSSSTTDIYGSFQESLIVPSVAPGDYPVQIDLPEGGSIEKSLTFTVTAATPSVTVSPTSGRYPDEIIITGSGFAAFASGNVTLAGSSKSVMTASDGTFEKIMTVPDVAAGTYPVEADIPSGGSMEASATFTVLVVRQMTLSPTHGDAGTSVSADGTGFWPNTSGRVFVDQNGNGRYDSGEPAQSLTTSNKGSFSISLTVPAGTPAGQYQILLDCPLGLPIEASATFTVGPPASTASITASPTSGHHGAKITVTGSGFAPGISGEVKLAGSNKSVTTSPTGTFSTIIAVPDVAPGDYPILADIPAGGSVEAHTPFTVMTPPPTASITLSPASGRYPQTITITGSGFAASTSGKVIFAGDSKSVTILSDGTFSTTMRVPLVGTGVYSVQADIPPGGSVEASATFVVTASY